MSRKIKKYKISNVLPGMILGRPIFSDLGSSMLNEGVILTQFMIDRLQRFGLTHIDILELPAAQKNISNIVAFQEKHTQIINALDDSFHKIRYLKEIPIQEFRNVATQTLESIVNSTGVLSYLSLAGGKDKYTLEHSVNVGVIAGVLGKWLGFNTLSLNELIFAGFLHDIGKTQIPIEILDKPGKLSNQEMDLMKSHTKLGHELIKTSLDVTEATKYAILQHHERLDGTGYPFKFSNSNISYISQIIAVADVYIAMTSNLAYRNALTPFKAMDDLSEEMFLGKLNPSICSVFLTHLRESLIGIHVKLTNGQTAKVIHIDKTNGAKPIVATTTGDFFDLAIASHLDIVGLVEI